MQDPAAGGGYTTMNIAYLQVPAPETMESKFCSNLLQRQVFDSAGVENLGISVYREDPEAVVVHLQPLK